jgi:hypothetical protein
MSTIDTSKEAMKLALEALEDVQYYGWGQTERDYDARTAAIAALREALDASLAEQPAPATELREQEPVFWTRKQWGMDREFCEKPFTTDWEPLYTSPPAQRTWVGLDNDDLVWIYSNSDNVGQAISNTEAKLKEKNT